MAENSNQIENRLWAAADEFRANSKLKSSEYPVLGLILLRYADQKFVNAENALVGDKNPSTTSSNSTILTYTFI